MCLKGNKIKITVSLQKFGLRLSLRTVLRRNISFGEVWEFLAVIDMLYQKSKDALLINHVDLYCHQQIILSTKKNTIIPQLSADNNFMLSKLIKVHQKSRGCSIEHRRPSSPESAQ